MGISCCGFKPSHSTRQHSSNSSVDSEFEFRRYYAPAKTSTSSSEPSNFLNFLEELDYRYQSAAPEVGSEIDGDTEWMVALSTYTEVVCHHVQPKNQDAGLEEDDGDGPMDIEVIEVAGETDGASSIELADENSTTLISTAIVVCQSKDPNTGREHYHSYGPVVFEAVAGTYGKMTITFINEKTTTSTTTEAAVQHVQKKVLNDTLEQNYGDEPVGFEAAEETRGKLTIKFTDEISATSCTTTTGIIVCQVKNPNTGLEQYRSFGPVVFEVPGGTDRNDLTIKLTDKNSKPSSASEVRVYHEKTRKGRK